MSRSPSVWGDGRVVGPDQRWGDGRAIQVTGGGTLDIEGNNTYWGARPLIPGTTLTGEIQPNIYAASTEAQLNAALNDINGGSGFSRTNTAY